MTIESLQEELKKKVVGQDEAIERVTVCFFKYFLKLKYKLKITSPNTLLLGNTGVGKTYIIKTICDILKFPFIEVNGSVMTKHGWKGESFLDVIENNKHKLLVYNGQVVIFLDEFDKLVQPMTDSHGENVAERVQAELLKFIEGCDFDFDKTLNSTKICFFFAGAFNSVVDKKDIIKDQIGFHRHKLAYTQELEEDLIKYGVLPELLGRIKDIIILNPLSRKMLETYASKTTVNNFVSHISEIEELTNFKIDSNMKERAIEAALKKKLGIRGYDSEMEKELDKYIIRNKHKLSFK